MSLQKRILWISLALIGMANRISIAADAFDAVSVGTLPSGWSAAKTGVGEGSVWKIQEDSTSPTGTKVLTQTSTNGPNGLFHLCVADQPQLYDVDLRVVLKPLSGKIDQGGGLVWRYQDENNYYVVRWNPLEGDFRLFHVIGGKRTQLGDTVKIASKVGEWHTIAVRHRGEDIDCFFVGVEDEEGVKFYSLPDFKLKGKTPIGKMFNDHILLTQYGRSVMVANFYSDDVVMIDLESMKETGRITGCSAPYVVKYGPLKQRAFVTCKKITGIAMIDPISQKLLKFHQLNVNPRSLTFSPDELKVYFGSFWVNGFFELDTESGKVTRLFSFDVYPEDAPNQEVTYHGVEAIGNNIVLAANEGRSFVDAVDVSTGKLLDRLTTVNKPCCVERIPGPNDQPARVLISNIGDATLQLVEVGLNGKMKEVGRTTVGKAPKRVAFVPAITR